MAEDLLNVVQEVFGDRAPQAQQYVDILGTRGIEWGLLGPREVPRLWDRHVLNSAAVGRSIPPGVSIVDVGSGAGLPGIPIALMRPDLQVTLLEPLQRRAHFLELAVEELGLSEQVTVVRARAEEHDQRHDCATARAVTNLGNLIRLCLPLLSPTGTIHALKGAKVYDEIDAARKVLTKFTVHVTVETVRLHPDVDSATIAIVSRD